MGGPFVMNTKTEITQAFSDFHSGEFGDIPARPPEVPLSESIGLSPSLRFAIWPYRHACAARLALREMRAPRHP
jgi:hypothetical protein